MLGCGLGHRQTRWINIEATLVNRPAGSVDVDVTSNLFCFDGIVVDSSLLNHLGSCLKTYIYYVALKRLLLSIVNTQGLLNGGHPFARLALAKECLCWNYTREEKITEIYYIKLWDVTHRSERLL